MNYWNSFLQIFRFDRLKLVRDFNYPNLVALFTILIIGIIADGQYKKIAMRELRTEVRDQISLVRAKLEGNINGNIQLVRGLISTLQTEPNMDQTRFTELAQHLFDEHSQLRNIAGAPDLVVSLMHPMKGNEKAIGLDYRKNAKQGTAALSVKNSGQMVLAGPVNLVQGGQGFIGRFPVFATKDNQRSFWGIVSAVIDVKLFYQASGLFDTDLPVEFALVGNDTAGNATEQFFGSKTVIDSQPVLGKVKFPNGSWTLAAIPKGGWNVIASDIWFERLLIFIAGIVLFIPVAIAGRFAEHRKNNVFELRKREEQLERLSKRLELALEASNVGVWEMNQHSQELVWDDRMNDLYYIPSTNTHPSYQDWQNALHPEDREQAIDDYQRAMDSKSEYSSEFRVVGASGRLRNIRAVGAYYEDASGSSRIIGLNWDVTADVARNEELKRAKSQMELRNVELLEAKSSIEYLALHDSLTGIPNRRYLDDYLAQIAQGQDSENSQCALLIIDLDRFKQINDTFGHAAGDAMLIHVSGMLKNSIRPGDFIARIGGDEFIVVCTVDNDTTHLEHLASSIIEKTYDPFIHDGSECRFGVSIGISHSGSVDTDIQQLLINADLALYHAKNQGRNRFEFFTKKLHINSMHNKKIADEIQRGIENNEFVPFYQPQYDAKTHSIVGVEALARWNHPEQGILYPNSFFGIADEINVSTAIDHAILRQTLDDFDRWSDSGLQIPKASVNVSLQRLHDEKLLNSLEKLCIKPGILSFELVESIFLDEDDDVVFDNIDRIKRMGIDIEIDDFGTGHTSIVSLLKLKPARLKIDRQLVIPATTSGASKQLLASIIEIGRSLDIEVIAEGVETAEHAYLLRKIGCDILQGFAFAKPMSSNELQDFMTSDLELFA